jgi:rod shape-determining protein MreD
VLRALISFVVAAVAVVVQITLVDRIAFPGGTGPDVVLLTVAALALANGPLVGALVGFWAGLALDVAPPGSHLVGQDALVFCLIGYACGLVADQPSGDGVPEHGHTALFEIVVTAAGAVLGEALSSLLDAMLSDPRVTWPAMKHVLPVAVAYDVLLSPFVLYAVAVPLRLAGARGDRGRAAWPALAAQAPVPSTVQGAVRQVGTSSPPRLRLPDRGKGNSWVRGQVASRPPAKREPRLNLSGSGSLGGSALGAAFAPGGTPRRSALSGSRGVSRALGKSASLKGFGGTPSLRGLGGQGSGLAGGLGSGPAKVSFAGRRHEGVLGGSLLGSSLFSGSGSGSAALRGSRFGRSRMGRSLLGGSVFSHSSSALTRPAPVRRPATLGRSSFLGRTSWLSWPSSPGRSGRLLRSGTGGMDGHAPRFARGSSSGRLARALRRPRSTVRKSPSRGWLRGTSSVSAATGRGAMSRRTMGRGAFGRGASSRVIGRSWTGESTPQRRSGKSARFRSARLHMPRPKAKRRRRTGGYR